ncbi:multiple sugar transport system ATP-binding protein [Paenibacillus sp. BK033]|uniref:ABC transporter ATP-binding protein n=1 Tax=Paenibacillus sp. BK033 TaxID=2512133 RepID=UPI0010480036|nr:ABC transporter ATP-binding protein [Paenibacillus sp. BK033]TCM89124.1 multiple sugar transport system ATP-binding protein [Paenibacillus sp. BK033]
MNAIELQGIHVALDGKQVLHDIKLTIKQGDFMTFLGPSGCGKTTLLRTIAGLQKADAGTITISGREVANGETQFHMEPSKRRLSLVFQSYALWPHMTVYENVAFGLQVRKLAKAVVREKVEAALGKMRIAELAGRYPSELSGGQQQRVAIARAIVTEPDILLLDEPLSNLDAKLRVEMRAELKRLHQELNTTVIYVTHDQHEAMTLSTQVAVFFGGRIVQLDKPRQLYKHPKTLQVAEFIGSAGMQMNRLEGVVRTDEEGLSWLETPVVLIPLAGGDNYSKPQLASDSFPDPSHLARGVNMQDGQEVVLTIRPEDIRLYEERCPGSIAMSVSAVFPSGAETLVQLDAAGMSLMARVIGESEYEPGITLYAVLRQDQMNAYDKKSGIRMELAYANHNNEPGESTHENRLSYSR